MTYVKKEINNHLINESIHLKSLISQLIKSSATSFTKNIITMDNNQEYFEVNKSLWNGKVATHVATKMYDMPSFLAGRNTLMEIELALLGDVKDKRILHLQCHFGQDSLSLARMGAKVTGVDFSSEAIAKATELNEQMGLDATFVESNVYDLKENLEGEFDIVFTSYGTIIWLPDLDKWASVIKHFLKPTGQFIMAEFHPVFNLFDFDTKEVAYDYFNKGVVKETTQGTYADQHADLVHDEYFWQHSLAETMAALLKQGLSLQDFQEYDYSPYNCYPNLEKIGEYKYRFGKVSLPHVFSLVMKQ